MKKQLYWEEVNIGQEVTSITKVASSLALVKWAGAYGDFNPLHYENDFAVNFMKTPGIIVHGTLKRQWLIQMLTDWAGDGGWLQRISTQFRAMDYPRKMKNLGEPEAGDTWQCRGKVTGKSEKDGQHLVECEIWLENGKGEATTSGTATVILPANK